MDLRNIQISAYRDVRSQSMPFTVSLWEWITTDKYKSIIEQLRNCSDSEMKAKLKSSLPCSTPSGLFGNDKELLKHSGLMVVDIDGKDNPDYSAEELKEKISEFVNVAFCGYSCSGLGVWALIPIQDPTKHLEHFRALQEQLIKENIIIDSACSNINRLRFASYDSEPYINENAEMFNIIWEEEKKPAKSLKTTRFVDDGKNPFDNFNQHGDVMSLLSNHGWSAVKQKSDRIYLQRPDKAGGGISGNFNQALRLFTSWSSSTVFEPRKAYNPSQVFNLLECSGDWKLTAKRLKELNY